MATREPRIGDRVRVGPLSACPGHDDPYLPGFRRHDPGEQGRTGTVLRVQPEPDPTHPFQVGFDELGGADFYAASELVPLGAFSLFDRARPRRAIAARKRLGELGTRPDDPWVLITSAADHDSEGIPVRSEGALRGDGVLPLSGKDARGWGGYRIAYLGLLLVDLPPAARPDHPREQYFVVWDDWTIDLWVLQIRHRDSPLYAERVTARTGPGPAGAIRGLELAREDAGRQAAYRELQPAYRGWRLLARLPLVVGGRRRLEESPTSQWRWFADQAIEMRRNEPRLSIKDAAVHLGLAWSDELIDMDDVDEGRFERAAEKRLRRWIKLRKGELGKHAGQ